MKPDIVRRYRRNPILTKAEIPYPVETVHNAAVVKHENEYIMLFSEIPDKMQILDHPESKTAPGHFQDVVA